KPERDSSGKIIMRLLSVDTCISIPYEIQKIILDKNEEKKRTGYRG
ncbi:unnamed protein product, partial [marine sediment metagenome]